MAIDPLQPDRATGHHGVKLGGGRIAPFGPQFLIPAAPQNPRPVRMRFGISGDPGQRFGQRVRVRQIERHRRKAHREHVRMAIDQSGHDHLALAVDQVSRARTFVAAVEHFGDAAIVTDHQRREMIDRAGGIKRDPIDIIKQRISHCRAGEGEQCGPSIQQRAHQALPRRGKRRTSAEVSCRPPPSACTSA